MPADNMTGIKDRGDVGTNKPPVLFRTRLAGAATVRAIHLKTGRWETARPTG